MTIYLDHAATTPPRAEALQAMWPYLTDRFGNPSSVHERGHLAADALHRARTVIAELTSAAPDDVIFTSGGTESNNLGIVGLALAHPRGRHVVAARTEHQAVLKSIDALERLHGFAVTWLDVNHDGSINLDDVAAAVRDDTTLLTLMLANNEVGVIHPVAAAADIAHARGALVHCDAVQAAGWLDLTGLNVDALALSGHKVGAPQGIGAVVIPARLRVEPTVWGGGQQDARRSGTENLPGAIALATALALDERDRHADSTERVTQLRDTLIDGVLSVAPNATLTGPRSNRAPHIASFVFSGVNGETVLLALEERGIICSSGSACAAGRTDPSHVLLALGYAPQDAQTAIRFSLGRETSAEDIAATIEALRDTLSTLTRSDGRAN